MPPCSCDYILLKDTKHTPVDLEPFAPARLDVWWGWGGGWGGCLRGGISHVYAAGGPRRYLTPAPPTPPPLPLWWSAVIDHTSRREPLQRLKNPAELREKH